ncbi:MAG: hypothetical protein PHE84_05695 [bacterium]|nr:hypothetical protein [bacterium]
MKKAIIISILFLLPTTANSYSLLQPETHGIRVSFASLLLAEEQPAEPPAGQPAPDIIHEEKSPDLEPEEKPVIYKPKNYWFPILWDLVPIPTLWLWANHCSQANGVHDENNCSDPLIKATIIGIPLWSIPPTIYTQPHIAFDFALPGGNFQVLFLAFLIYEVISEKDKPDYFCCDSHPVNEECCQEYIDMHFYGKERKEEYLYLVISASALQAVDIIFHTIFVKRNNALYQEQQLRKQVYITPYIDKDRAGLACQYSF